MLDTNEDRILNQDDLEFYVKPEEKIPRLSQTIANKNKEFNEIGFDMKIRKAGAIDFTLPQENERKSSERPQASKDYRGDSIFYHRYKKAGRWYFSIFLLAIDLIIDAREDNSLTFLLKFPNYY